MLRQVLDAVGLAVALDIVTAGIDGPERIRDLAADQLVVGIAGAESYVHLPLRQVEIAVAGDEFDPQMRMARMKTLDQARLRHADDDRLRTGHADRALQVLLDVGCPPLEIPDSGLDTFGKG